MPRDRDNPTTADEWEAFGRVPAGNKNVEEGCKYFDIHDFHFSEGRYYSQLTAGFDTSFSDGYTAWRTLLAKWERETAPSFGNWRRRTDMQVIADARRQEKGDGYLSGPVSNDIIRSCYPNSMGKPKYVWTNRANTDGGIVTVVKEESLKQTRVRVQCLALSHDMDASIWHNTVYENTRHIPTPQAKLVVWVETDLSRNELAWRWFGSVYSWRHLMMEAVSSCDGTTKARVDMMIMPLVREWTQLIREVGQKHTTRQVVQGAQPNSPITAPRPGDQKIDSPAKPFTFDTDLGDSTPPSASAPVWIKRVFCDPPLVVTGGETCRCIVQLGAPVNTETVVKISSDRPDLALPEKPDVIIPEGEQEGSVNIRTFRVVSDTKSTLVAITATVNRSIASSNLFVETPLKPLPLTQVDQAESVKKSRLVLGNGITFETGHFGTPMTFRTNKTTPAGTNKITPAPLLAGIGIWVHRDGFTKEGIANASVIGGQGGEKVSFFVWLSAPSKAVVVVKSDRPDVADVAGESRIELDGKTHSAYIPIKTQPVTSDTSVTFTAINIQNATYKTVTLIVKSPIKPMQTTK